jgi:predicted  nucleic acid-binding Zn-ribbon protein
VNFEVKDLIQLLGAAVSAGILIGTLIHLKSQVGHLWNAIKRMTEWREKHEETSVRIRTDFWQEITNLRVAGAKTDQKFDSIMDTLEEIKEKLKGLKKDA